MRMNKSETYEFLDSKGIKYEITEHKAIFNTIISLPLKEIKELI